MGTSEQGPVENILRSIMTGEDHDSASAARAGAARTIDLDVVRQLETQDYDESSALEELVKDAIQH